MEGKPYEAKFEFDLYGVGVDAGQTTMRVRHAYMNWGPFLVGQTNTLFMDGSVKSIDGGIDFLTYVFLCGAQDGQVVNLNN